MTDPLFLERRFSQDANLRRLIGDRVRLLRVGRDMTQRTLAKRAGTTANTVRGLERGFLTTRWSKVAAIATVLDLTVEQLIESAEAHAADPPAIKELLNEDLEIARAYHHCSSEVRERVRMIVQQREYVQRLPENDAEAHALLVRYRTLPSHKQRLVQELITVFEAGEQAPPAIRRDATNKP
jgi:transcriptional regulator with XRE-family HTH domain